MAANTTIEWTDATWNSVTGCVRIDPGCDNFYAERFAERWRGVPGHPYEQGFNLRLWPGRLDQPAHWKTPRRIFVNSMSDLFLKDIPYAFLDQMFDAMERASWHIYLTAALHALPKIVCIGTDQNRIAAMLASIAEYLTSHLCPFRHRLGRTGDLAVLLRLIRLLFRLV